MILNRLVFWYLGHLKQVFLYQSLYSLIILVAFNKLMLFIVIGLILVIDLFSK